MKKLNEIILNNGACDFGYTEDPLASSYDLYNSWLSKELNKPLHYLEGERGEQREDLRKVFPQFASALVCLFPYIDEKKALADETSGFCPTNNLSIAGYAMGFEGNDYHYVISDHLNNIAKELSVDVPNLEYKVTVDIFPILERDLAVRAGLGWIGKNSMLINRKYGSYVMIGSLLLSEKLDIADKGIDTDHCGQCRACIDACPTNAITSDRTLNTQKCISTFTIELFKDAEPMTGYIEANNYFFGCDICQEVCPWNTKPLNNSPGLPSVSDKSKLIVDFFGHRKLTDIIHDLEEMSNNKYQKIFKGTSLQRTGRIGLLKNLRPLVKDS